MLKRVIVLAVLLALMTGVPVASASDRPVVRGVLFWADGCHKCETVLRDVLPPLQAQYGSQLDIQKIEVSGQDHYAVFRQLEEHYKVPVEMRGVPALFLADRLLVGDQQILAELPRLVQQYLASGGIDYPRLAGLSTLLPTVPDGEPLAAVHFSPFQEPGAATGNNGFALAIGIMIAMGLALLYALVTTARAGSQGMTMAGPGRADALIPVLAVLGMVVAAYLTFVETQNVAAICGPVGDCNTVQASPYARLFGFLPIGLLGLLGYVGILGAWLIGRFGRDRLAELARLAAFAMALFGVLFSLYLTYLEPFVIGAVCAWCLTSAVLITLLMLLTLRPALAAMTGGADEEVDEDDEGEGWSPA